MDIKRSTQISHQMKKHKTKHARCDASWPHRTCIAARYAIQMKCQQEVWCPTSNLMSSKWQIHTDVQTQKHAEQPQNTAISNHGTISDPHHGDALDWKPSRRGPEVGWALPTAGPIPIPLSLIRGDPSALITHQKCSPANKHCYTSIPRVHTYTD